MIGGHYDSAFSSPGANDNATGAAAVLALAGELVGTKPLRTLRFVKFTNEEPPYFWTKNMGSLVYAQAAKQRGDKIDFDKLSRVTYGISKVIRDFVGLAG